MLRSVRGVAILVLSSLFSSVLVASGTNGFHGSLYEYNRSSIGEANDWFNKAAGISSGLPNNPGHLIRNTFGATFGANSSTLTQPRVMQFMLRYSF